MTVTSRRAGATRSPGTAVPRRARKTTIVDIAEAAGVSVTTVSRILNDKPDVAERTRTRVLDVMDELGFAPQNAWRQIRSGRSQLIAMHYPQDFNVTAHGLLTSAALGFRADGYSVSIMTKPLTDSELLATFRGGLADGMILMEVATVDRRATVLRDHGYPFVMVGRPADSTGMSFVDIDIELGLGLAIDHLAGLGHRSIAYVASMPIREEREYGYPRWALHGYEQACHRHGLTPRPYLVAAEDTPSHAAAAVQEMMAGPDRPTAIVAPQETCVIGIVRAVQALGLKVPEELSVVGLLAQSAGELTTPPMTTISFPDEEMGSQAARILLAQMDGTADGPEQVLVPPELVVRGSTGPAPER